MKDSLGDRMKAQYEDRTRYMLPRRTHTILRIDGKAFHTFTRSMEKPFFLELHQAMISATKHLCAEAQGARIGYVQSDEASILLTDFAEITTQAWFDGNLQKICSIGASVFTEAFSQWRHGAHFDCRAFTIADPIEVENYFVWRNKDAVRNSISSLAQSQFSAKQLHNKDQAEMLMMCSEVGRTWHDQPDWARFGSVIYRETYIGAENSVRSRWSDDAAFVFASERERFSKLLGQTVVKESNNE